MKNKQQTYQFTAKRLPMWLPYLQEVKENKKGVFTFRYNGGEVTTDLSDVQSIMIYGDVDTSLPISYIDSIIRKGVPIIIHRRNMAQALYLTGGNRPDPNDTLTYQLLMRNNMHNRKHIARQLLKAKFVSMKWLMDDMPRLTLGMSIGKLRQIEAQFAREYWRRYFTLLGHPEWTRRDKNPYSMVLDASSKFVSGVLLRWVHYHHLSAYHGFLHEPTDYPSLVYDLMEPYRGLYEKIVFNTLRMTGSVTTKETALLGACINAIKEAFDQKVYTGLTRQIVTRQELLHGIVLSLKYYLLGKQTRFMIPMETSPNGGRPPKVVFQLYGRQAGKTDFWVRAREAANESRKIMAVRRKSF